MMMHTLDVTMLHEQNSYLVKTVSHFIDGKRISKYSFTVDGETKFYNVSELQHPFTVPVSAKVVAHGECNVLSHYENDAGETITEAEYLRATKALRANATWDEDNEVYEFPNLEEEYAYKKALATWDRVIKTIAFMAEIKFNVTKHVKIESVIVKANKNV